MGPPPGLNKIEKETTTAAMSSPISLGPRVVPFSLWEVYESGSIPGDTSPGSCVCRGPGPLQDLTTRHFVLG